MHDIKNESNVFKNKKKSFLMLCKVDFLRVFLWFTLEMQLTHQSCTDISLYNPTSHKNTIILSIFYLKFAPTSSWYDLQQSLSYIEQVADWCVELHIIPYLSSSSVHCPLSHLLSTAASIFKSFGPIRSQIKTTTFWQENIRFLQELSFTSY